MRVRARDGEDGEIDEELKTYIFSETS